MQARTYLNSFMSKLNIMGLVYQGKVHNIIVINSDTSLTCFILNMNHKLWLSI